MRDIYYKSPDTLDAAAGPQEPLSFEVAEKPTSEKNVVIVTGLLKWTVFLISVTLCTRLLHGIPDFYWLFMVAAFAVAVFAEQVLHFYYSTARAALSSSENSLELGHRHKDIRRRFKHRTIVRPLQILTGVLVGGCVLELILARAATFHSAGTSAAFIVVSFGLLIAALYRVQTARESRFISTDKAIANSITALAHWYYHLPHQSAHGVFRGSGWHSDRSTRIVVFGLTFWLFFSVFASTAAFFPVTLRSTGAWFRVVVDKDDDQRNFSPANTFKSRAELITKLNASSENWIRYTFSGSSSDDCMFFFVGLLASLVLTALLSVLSFLGVFVLIVGPEVSRIERLWQRTLDSPTAKEWDERINLMQSMPFPEERNSLLIGYHATDHYPIVIPRRILEEHCHLLGDSGSGKTALGLLPMITQIIRMAGRDNQPRQRHSLAPPSFKSSIVVMDLKGDMAMFHTARLEAAAAGLPFRWFNLEYGRSTYGFNPFTQGHVEQLSTMQFTELLTEALGLSQPDDAYGQSHYSNIHQEVVGSILEAHPHRIRSFREFYDLSTDRNLDLLGKKLKLSQKKKDDAGDVLAVFRKLAAIEALNIVPGEESVGIDLHDVLYTPQVVYFFLPAGLSQSSVRFIGKLALQSLLSAAVMRRRELEERGVHTTADEMQRVYLFIDEFQQVISENLEIFFRQARSMRIATILANQTLSDLKKRVDLTGTVMANTRLKQYFSSTDLAQQQILIDASGEAVDYSETGLTERARELRKNNGETATQDEEPMGSENVVPRISRNHIIEASNDPSMSVVHLPRSDGYAQFQGYPFLMRSVFHLDREEYNAREATPWPAPTNETCTFEAKADSEPHCPVDPVPPVGPLYDAVEAKPRHGTSKFDEAFENIVAGQKARQSKQKQRRKS